MSLAITKIRSLFPVHRLGLGLNLGLNLDLNLHQQSTMSPRKRGLGVWVVHPGYNIATPPGLLNRLNF
jgi:hypothetical protein